MRSGCFSPQESFVDCGGVFKSWSAMSVVFCFLFKNIPREKEREGPSTLYPSRVLQILPLLQSDGKIQDGCPHVLVSHSAYTFSFSFFFNMYFTEEMLYLGCSELELQPQSLPLLLKKSSSNQ